MYGSEKIENGILYFVKYLDYSDLTVLVNDLSTMPRIGDEYQAFVDSFNDLPTSDNGGSSVSNFKGTKEDQQVIRKREEMDDRSTECFVAGLAVPVMKIHQHASRPCFKNSDKDCSHQGMQSVVHHLGNERDDKLMLLHGEEVIRTDTVLSMFTNGVAGIVRNNPGTGEDSACLQIFQNGSGKSADLELEEINMNKGGAWELAMCGSQRRWRKRKGRGAWRISKKVNVQTTNIKCQNRFLASDSVFAGLADKVEAPGLRKFALVPGSPVASWSKNEVAAFIVGVYFLGKDFVALKQFLETKTMGDVIGFYYGKFYGTEFYSKWADSRNYKSRRCIHGQRLLSGWRQQELLRRVLPYVDEMSYEVLLEAAKSYNDGGISLEEFVVQLKATAGLDSLVRAVGLGAGKLDLTVLQADPGRSCNPTMVHADIPMGKAYSYLSSEEIGLLLNGNFRLSKARAHDLFWEAVWPRLLARGWHSEQVGDQENFGLQSSLVFLIAGVHRFRRSLIKGSQYFDSVSEVLNLVAANFSLLDPPSDFNPVQEAVNSEEVLLDDDVKTIGSSDGSLGSPEDIAEESEEALATESSHPVLKFASGCSWNQAGVESTLHFQELLGLVESQALSAKSCARRIAMPLGEMKHKVEKYFTSLGCLDVVGDKDSVSLSVDICSNEEEEGNQDANSMAVGEEQAASGFQIMNSEQWLPSTEEGKFSLQPRVTVTCVKNMAVHSTQKSVASNTAHNIGRSNYSMKSQGSPYLPFFWDGVVNGDKQYFTAECSQKTLFQGDGSLQKEAEPSCQSLKQRIIGTTPSIPSQHLVGSEFLHFPLKEPAALGATPDWCLQDQSDCSRLPSFMQDGQKFGWPEHERGLISSKQFGSQGDNVETKNVTGDHKGNGLKMNWAVPSTSSNFFRPDGRSRLDNLLASARISTSFTVCEEENTLESQSPLQVTEEIMENNECEKQLERAHLFPVCKNDSANGGLQGENLVERRHSSRSRPLTLRALEALVCGPSQPKRMVRKNLETGRHAQIQDGSKSSSQRLESLRHEFTIIDTSAWNCEGQGGMGEWLETQDTNLAELQRKLRNGVKKQRSERVWRATKRKVLQLKTVEEDVDATDDSELLHIDSSFHVERWQKPHPFCTVQTLRSFKLRHRRPFFSDCQPLDINSFPCCKDSCNAPSSKGTNPFSRNLLRRQSSSPLPAQNRCSEKELYLYKWPADDLRFRDQRVIGMGARRTGSASRNKLFTPWHTVSLCS